jgi:multidrug efflux pump subunit AcrA (membrane-fusion protein)
MQKTDFEVLPYKLQMFAEGDDNGNEGDNTPDSQSNDDGKSEPDNSSNDDKTVEDKLNEALAELAKERAEKEKTKKALDKEMSKSKQLTNDLRSKMTADEQRKADEEAANKELEERAVSAERELNRMKAVQAYKAIDNDDTVNTLIDAVNDKDHTSIATIIENEVKKAIASKEAEWKKSRPPIETGDGSGASMSVDEIMAIKDTAERHRQIALHKDLF